MALKGTATLIDKEILKDLVEVKKYTYEKITKLLDVSIWNVHYNVNKYKLKKSPRGKRPEHKKPINEAKELATKRSGQCLSTTYRWNKKLKWKCHKNHIFTATKKNVKKGRWCPVCKLSVGESITKIILEQIFKKKFKSHKKFTWLIYKKSNQGMHLDLYNKQMNLAFEFNGKQHYVRTVLYHKTEQDFMKRQKYDLIKQSLCKEHDIILISIPYTLFDCDIFDTNNIDKTVHYINEKLIENNLNPILDITINTNAFTKVFNIKENDIRSKEIKQIAKNNKMKVISKFVNKSTHIKLKCTKCGHTTKLVSCEITNKLCCKKCKLIHKRLEISKKYKKELLIHFKNKGIECLSTDILNQNDLKNDSILDIKCNTCDNSWQAPVSRFRIQKTGCLICHNRRISKI